ncbi:hypothetical protein Poli38472_003516 [Pythium oligandrum]|uniref:60S ribosomal export protein NMD3 n=1 Tax=Pythium oligandrum TaxID=41045 RepID=A0A8K1C6N7_PYTOL|nr:hypothetical protein Poli38472_003516 [Pythium oligandrum]|eukprot:TMW57591.1 hypothetical protein Poli38472_003516 [Pythium oligandrum]
MAILCCVCGVEIEPNSMNMCNSCIAAEVDIAEGIDLESDLLQCSGCLRYLSRGKGTTGGSINGAWLDCEWESTELMALCLKNVHGLNKAKLMDANFIWTEPHSKRIKVKLLLQREMLNHALVQNSCVVTYVIKNAQCPDCMKKYRNNTWRALVQIRQKADHKRTFFRLEQLILKHKAHEHAIGIVTVKEGIDFYFGMKNAAERFIRFLSARVPMRTSSSHKLVSENVRQGTANVQTVYSVELSPICKDDLLVLPAKTAQSCSNVSQLVLCARTTSMTHVLDPRTGRKGELTADKFWKTPFLPLETSTAMTEFIVLDVEPVYGGYHGGEKSQNAQQGVDDRIVVADIEVARASDFGVNDTTFLVRSHLGGILEAGDSVRGYDLSSANFGSRQEYLLKGDFPDVVLVRKVFPREQKRKNKKEIKQLSSERGMRLSKAEAAKHEKEFEQFAEEFLEEEEEEDDELFDMEGTFELDGGDDDDEEAAQLAGVEDELKELSVASTKEDK